MTCKNIWLNYSNFNFFLWDMATLRYLFSKKSFVQVIVIFLAPITTKFHHKNP